MIAPAEQNRSRPLLEEYHKQQKAHELYPVTHLAYELGICYKEPGGPYVFESDWSPLAIREHSFLGYLLNLPFVERFKGVGQLGPHREKPYSYSHTIYDHTAEQLVRGVSRLAHLAESQPDLFLLGTDTYEAADDTNNSHLSFILRIASWSILLHDAESLPLRDTAKFAFKTSDTITDENMLLVRRLSDPNDLKYLPYLREAFGKRLDMAIEIIRRIAQRLEPTFIGDFLHSRDLPDPNDPSGHSRPLDNDKITYLIQDALSVFGDLFFDRTLDKETSEIGRQFFGAFTHKVANLFFVKQKLAQGGPNDDWWAKIYMPRKVNPMYLDLTCSAVLVLQGDGGVTVAYEDDALAYDLISMSALDSFPGLYFYPPLLYKEKLFEREVQRHFRRWKPGKRQQFIDDTLVDWTDGELLEWIDSHWPRAIKALNIDIEGDWNFHHQYLSRKPRCKRGEVAVPIHIHSATSTPVVDRSGRAVPISIFSPEAVDDFHRTLALYNDKWLFIGEPRRIIMDIVDE